ncbi:MAG: DUF935 family protein [Verrucomicrobiota bacterium]
MPKPLFLKNADELDKWLQQFNPLRGATLSTLSDWFSEADEGKFAHVMWMARKMIRRDPVIRACVQRLANAMRGLDWQVKIMEELPPGITEAMAEAQSDYLKQRYSAVTNLRQSYTALAKADFLGFAHLEKHYDSTGHVCRLEPVPQWHWVRNGLYGKWQYNPSATPYGRNLRDINPEDFIIHEVDDPWLEIALVAGLDLNQLSTDLRGFCARYGIPNTFFIAGPGTTDEDMDDLNAVAAELAADGTGVLPNGATVDTHESQSKGEIFEMAGKFFKEQIVLAATGGLLTMLAESGSGNLAGGAHSESWRSLAKGVAADLSELYQDQLDAPWLEEKFPGQAVAVYFELEFPDEPVDRKELAETVSKLQTAGFHVDGEWLSEEISIPFLKAEDVKEDKSPGLPSPSRKTTANDRKPPSTTVNGLGRIALLNRFTGGPPSARDRAEAEQLVETTLAESLQVMRGMLAPLQPDITALINKASAEDLSAADFLRLAQEVEGLLPELVTEEGVQLLANRIEAAMGSAAALGARASIRKRKAASKA